MFLYDSNNIVLCPDAPDSDPNNPAQQTAPNRELDDYDPMREDWFAPENRINKKRTDLTMPADTTVSFTAHFYYYLLSYFLLHISFLDISESGFV